MSFPQADIFHNPYCTISQIKYEISSLAGRWEKESGIMIVESVLVSACSASGSGRLVGWP